MLTKAEFEVINVVYDLMEKAQTPAIEMIINCIGKDGSQVVKALVNQDLLSITESFLLCV
jgi:hypothetical protein